MLGMAGNSGHSPHAVGPVARRAVHQIERVTLGRRGIDIERLTERAIGFRVSVPSWGVGTGGTVTGVAKRLKKELPNVTVVGVDPYGSILGGGNEIHSYSVEGIGYDFFPDVLDNTIVDKYVKVNDKDSFLVARRLIREEGLLAGGSSGSAVWAALQVAGKLKKTERCLVILPDGVRNYMTKFVDDQWMKEQGFFD